MIGRLSGVLLEKQAPSLLLDVNGVGYEVEAPMTTFYQLPEIGQAATLHTHLVVREDAQLLYGFATQTERRVFRSLIKVNGVGARMALTILSGMSVDAFLSAIHENDTASLVKLPGVGKKTAERLVIEMKDRLKDLEAAAADWHPTTAPVASTKAVSTAVDDAAEALVALGYKPAEARKMLQSLDIDEDSRSEDLIRQALQGAAGKVSL